MSIESVINNASPYSEFWLGFPEINKSGAYSYYEKATQPIEETDRKALLICNALSCVSGFPIRYTRLPQGNSNKYILFIPVPQTA